MKKYFLWNEPNFSNVILTDSSSYIEDFFSDIFYPFKVIYLSRARHFIPLLLDVNNLGRNNIVFTQPYSSHCVLSNISLQSTPSIINGDFVNASIIYHQYGYKTVVNEKNKYNNILFEDAVDTIFLDTTEKELFPNNGLISIISLPKIMKIPFGSIGVFKDEEIYKKVKLRIESNVNDSFLTNSFYEKALKNPSHREVLLSQYKILSPRVDNIESLYISSINRVKENVNLIKDYFSIEEDFSKRLPSNIIMDNPCQEQRISRLIDEPFRNIYNYNTGEIIKKQLIPVHCGVDWKLHLNKRR